MRSSLVGVVKAFLKPQILIPLVAMLAWIGLELSIGVRLELWNPALAKGTIWWTLGSAGVLLFNYTQIASNGDDRHFFRRTILATVGVAAFVEFFVNLYVMSLPLVLGFQMVVAVPSVMVAVARQKPELQSVKVFCKRVLVLIGLALFALVVRQIYTHWHQLDARELLLEFMLPVWLTVGLVPFLYIFSIYVAYDAIFRRISGDETTRRSRWRSRFALLSVLYFRASAVRRFTGYLYFTTKLGEAQTFRAARAVVANFLDELSRTEKAKLDEERRSRRYSGSQELDDEGRRLDRREFAATMDALRWLATCQMGWHRKGGRYRRDMLKILGHDFTRQGLPGESGVSLHVARGDQSWYTWRRTVTGWCFAIGAAGPPPDQWRYDGPEPPGDFPGEDDSWGDGPFSDQVNRNWC
ncbi:MAG: hypothetical protein F4236_04665 [Acidimicrobiia bacterium]|nr:hypothetical protein [Acidimicrobiia bacterium]